MIREEINEIKNRKIEKSQWSQKLVLWKVNKTEKPLVRLTEKKKKEDHNNKILWA